VKLNSNSGWVNHSGGGWSDVMQALSHFSYSVTGGNLLLCDIQGGTFNKGFAITDPVIISNFAGRYGPTDLGKDGIITFFAYHDCNDYCNASWRRPKYRSPVFNMKRGTSMFLPKAKTSRYY